MIVPDVNLLVYAHDEAFPGHDTARDWWSTCLGGTTTVGVPWAVSMGFVRIVTNPAALLKPRTASQAMDIVDDWFLSDAVVPLDPGPQHLRIVRQLFDATGVAAGLTTDAHLAAISIEHQATLCSNDRDFERFPGLKLENPVRA